MQRAKDQLNAAEATEGIYGRHDRECIPSASSQVDTQETLRADNMGKDVVQAKKMRNIDIKKEQVQKNIKFQFDNEVIQRMS